MYASGAYDCGVVDERVCVCVCVCMLVGISKIVGIFIFQNLHLPNENNSRGFWLFTAFGICAKCELLRRKYEVSHALPAGCFPLYSIVQMAKEPYMHTYVLYNINCIFLYYSKFPNGKSSGQHTCTLLYLSYKQVY